MKGSNLNQYNFPSRGFIAEEVKKHWSIGTWIIELQESEHITNYDYSWWNFLRSAGNAILDEFESVEVMAIRDKVNGAVYDAAVKWHKKDPTRRPHVNAILNGDSMHRYRSLKRSELTQVELFKQSIYMK